MFVGTSDDMVFPLPISRGTKHVALLHDIQHRSVPQQLLAIRKGEDGVHTSTEGAGSGRGRRVGLEEHFG